MKYFILAFTRSFEFEGRSTRKEFWMFYLIHFVLMLSFITIDFVYIGSFLLLTFGYQAISFLPFLSLTIRRLHDINESWLNLSVLLIPAIGILWFFSKMWQKSDEGINRFGANPLDNLNLENIKKSECITNQ